MKPERVFRIGSVSASVFLNTAKTEGGEREMRSVSLQRRYRDSDGGWKSSSNFNLGDLPQAIAALNLAMAYVAENEAIVVG